MRYLEIVWGTQYAGDVYLRCTECELRQPLLLNTMQPMRVPVDYIRREDCGCRDNDGVRWDAGK